MKTLLLPLLCLFVWSQSTEALTDQQVVLGQKVTLSCEYRLKAVIWFVLKLPARPEMILRTFGSQKKAEYYNKKFSEKYFEGDRSQLVINKVSEDDLGIYYCIEPGFALDISDGIRLYIAEMSQDDSSHTTLHNPEYDQRSPSEPEHSLRLIQIIIIMFSLLIVVLFAVPIGLLIKHCKRSKEIPKYANAHQTSTRRRRESKVSRNPGPVYLEVLPNI